MHVAFADNGRVLITQSDGIHRWDLETGRRLGRVIPGQFAAISPDGSLLAVQRTDGSLRVMPAATPASGAAADLRLALLAATATDWTTHQSIAPLEPRQLVEAHAAIHKTNVKLSLVPLPKLLLPPQP